MLSAIKQVFLTVSTAKDAHVQDTFRGIVVFAMLRYLALIFWFWPTLNIDTTFQTLYIWSIFSVRGEILSVTGLFI